MPYEPHRLFRIFLQLLALALLLAGPAGLAPLRAEDDDPVRSCFEGPANQAALAADAKDDFSRNLAEIGAGIHCEGLAAEVIESCLARIDAEAEDDARDYYPCIGIVANPCIDSSWATSEFRSVVCVGTEEKVWLEMVHEGLDRLRTSLDDELKQRLQSMEKAFFEFRNEKCGLLRSLREGKEPDLAYGACTTETAARLAIDLRDMAGLAKAPPSGDAAYPGTREGAEQLLRALLDEDADCHELTLALRPQAEDYAALYEQPLAGQIEKHNAALWAADEFAIAPDDGQSEVRIDLTTSDELIAGGAALQRFPGGYKAVAAQMKPGIPIAAFAFHAPGADHGMAFDGLAYVNGRWVFIPKPWKALP